MNRLDKIPVWLLMVSLIIFWGISQPVGAAVFKWVDETGKVHYTNNKSKIPRKYRNQKDLKKVRTVGPDSGVQVEGAPSRAPSRAPGGKGESGGGVKGDDSPEILSAEDEALVNAAMGHLVKEIQFTQNHADDMATPTSQRGFVVAIQGLNAERDQMVSRLSSGTVPVLKEVRQHIGSQLEVARANPVSVRRMSVSTAIDNLNSQSGSNRSLIEKLKQTLATSAEKKKEKAEKAKAAEKENKTAQKEKSGEK